MTFVNTENLNFENATPYPEFLIKSIAEQGYTLETSLADLIDNSVSAGADNIEILINTDSIPFKLFLSDNGIGMNEENLKSCMQFPSCSMENDRNVEDLGRFGLGMKTASFAQTRRLTVMSRSEGTSDFAARTWDVEYLKQKKEWRIIVNTKQEINNLGEEYKGLSSGFLNEFSDFRPNTIVVWKGLYKFEDYLEGSDRSESLKNQITEITTEYLSLVFHRFMERAMKPLKIRVNNVLIKPFNPFPTCELDLRLIESKQKYFKTDVIKLEGFILPGRSIEESKEINNIWTTKSKGLMDMEGLYIYRADRIILFGGWNGIIRKSPRLQLARLRVEVGNRVDHLMHLNVAKSKITIPYDLKIGFLKYIVELKEQAIKEYYNRGLRKISSKKTDLIPQLFERVASNKGTLLELNRAFPQIKLLFTGLDNDQQRLFKVLMKMINTGINRLRQSHEDKNYYSNTETDLTSAEDLEMTIRELISNGTSKEIIKQAILPALGYRIDTIPEKITNLLK